MIFFILEERWSFQSSLKVFLLLFPIFFIMLSIGIHVLQINQVFAIMTSQVTGDFNGDGKDDLAIGVANEDLGTLQNAGAVEVIYGYRHGLDPKLGDQFLTQGSLTNNPAYDGRSDGFGYSLVVGDFNSDGLDDLAIGVPYDLIGAIRPGAVYVVYGTVLGLAGDENPRVPLQIFLQGSAGVIDVQEDGDRLGYSLSSGDFNGDDIDDLAIGVPYEDTGLIQDTGGVEVIHGTATGLSATLPIADQFWTQKVTDVEDEPERADHFGSSISSGDFNGDGIDDLGIGVADEDLGTIQNAGGVEVIHGTATGLSATLPIADQFWTQDTPDVEGVADISDHFGVSLSSGDFNGDGKDDLGIGIENGNAGSIPTTGAVEVIHGTATGLSATLPIADQFWTQDSPDVEGVAGDSEKFGFPVSSGDFNGDGKDDLAMAVTREDISSRLGAGGVEVIHGTATGLSATLPITDQFWTQDSPDVDDVAEISDFFGSSLSSGDFNGDNKDDLTIGIQEDLGSLEDVGAVEVIHGTATGLSATLPIADQFWTQDSDSVKDVAEDGDAFGGERPD